MQTIDLTGQKDELVIADAKQFKETLDRLLSEILASLEDQTDVAFIGIRSRGVHLARRLANGFMERTGRYVDVGTLDITF